MGRGPSGSSCWRQWAPFQREDETPRCSLVEAAVLSPQALCVSADKPHPQNQGNYHWDTPVCTTLPCSHTPLHPGAVRACGDARTRGVRLCVQETRVHTTHAACIRLCVVQDGEGAFCLRPGVHGCIRPVSGAGAPRACSAATPAVGAAV